MISIKPVKDSFYALCLLGGILILSLSTLIGADQPTQWWMVVASYPGLDRRTAWQPLRLVGTLAAKAIQDAATTHGCHSQIVHVLVIVAWLLFFVALRSRSNRRRIQNSVSILLLHVVGEMRHFCILVLLV